MRTRLPLALLPALVALSYAFFARSKSSAENAETPIGPKWWPSKWGADDQRGAANLLTEKKVLEAKEPGKRSRPRPRSR